MNMCFVCNEYPPARHGGIGIFVQSLGQQLVKLGHNVYVVGYDEIVDKIQWTEENNIHVLRLPVPKSWVLKLGRYNLSPAIVTNRVYLSAQVQKICKEYNIDVVESYDWSGPLGFKPFSPLIVRMHGANSAYAYAEGKRPSRLLKYLEKRNLQMADHLLSVSQHIGETTLKACGLGKQSYETIYNGVDVNMFQPDPRIHKDHHMVLYVGRIHPRKGIKELLQAWPTIIENSPDARLILVGGGADEVQTSNLLEGIPSGIHSSIVFQGFVPNQQLPTWYCRAAVTVFPSRAEAFGITCAEAMACGSAVVMTRRASGPELIEDQVSGLLIEPSNPLELAGSIVRLLNSDDQRRKFGFEARKRVVEHFNMADLGHKNERMYLGIVDNFKAL